MLRFRHAALTGFLFLLVTRAGADTGRSDPAASAARVLAAEGVRGTMVIRTPDGALHASDARRARRGFLPASLRIVREILIVDRGPGWVLRAKMGWAARGDPEIGWYVGWVGREDGGTYTLAVNLDMVAPADRAKRESIARQVLAELGAFR